VELGVEQVIAAGGYPCTSVLSSWHSMASLLTLKLLRAGRVDHATGVADDEALGLAVGLNVLPKATHDRTYSYRVRREMNTAALAEVVRRLRPIGLPLWAVSNILGHASIAIHKRCLSPLNSGDAGGGCGDCG